MRKLKLSTAIQRQIPDYIRTNYPYFVEFVKAYYEFLQQSQERNLEGYRDIDTTLESFLDNFKSELSENFPVDLSKDKRQLLRNLREFYLSRGSEASYKFLFKVLFEKEATLYYPSKQVLRVSDGKWIQENSIFVKSSNPSQDLFPLSGKFVKINTSNRTIEAYVSNVVEYKSDIYELSLLNDISNTFLEVGSSVIYVDGSTKYSGVIVKTPVKISVYKKGKGFKLGDIFSLKTDLGNGCIVKVTKIDSEGGIEAVHVIKFGLDYETTFWSYLAPGQLEGFEFIQPTTLWQNGTYLPSRKITSITKTLVGNKYEVTITTSEPHTIPISSTITVTSSISQVNGTFKVTFVNGNILKYTMTTGSAFTTTAVTSADGVNIITKPYQESAGGFLEYGYATKQTYIEYDTGIPVAPNLGRDADRYYVESDYVGDIVNQFYNEQEGKDPTSDYAIIQIDLGAVAKYPGYYAASDSFISDEIYLQDGYYYQTYSYVVKVEEELKKYYSIVKNVLHPSGLKLFAEYDIFNEIDLTVSEREALRNLQFSENISSIIDRGYSYSSYDDVILQGGNDPITTLIADSGIEQTKYRTIQVTPSDGAIRINSPVGKASKYVYKPRTDFYEFSQIQGKTASIEEAHVRQDALDINPNQYFPGHDVLEEYYLEKNSERDLTFVDTSDIIFVGGTGRITSTSTNLDIFPEGEQVIISGAYNFTNNGTYAVQSSSANELILEEVTFIQEDPSLSVANPYTVIIRLDVAPFNDYEKQSSAGFGYISYQTSLDLLGNVISYPINSQGSPILSNTALVTDQADLRTTTNKAYTRTFSLADNTSGNLLWNSTIVDINNPSSYNSHSSFYLSVNSSERYALSISNYICDGSNTVYANYTGTPDVKIGDIIRVNGLTQAPQSNINGTWIITDVNTGSNLIEFNIESTVDSGIYSNEGFFDGQSIIGAGNAYSWRPNDYFTDYTDKASSGFGYTSYQVNLDSLGNPVVYPLNYLNSPITSNANLVSNSSDIRSTVNKVYTKDTTISSFFNDSTQQTNYYTTVDNNTVYNSDVAYDLRLNVYPRTSLAVTSYSGDGTNIVTANVASTSSLAVGDIIRISDAGGTSQSRRNIVGTWTISEIVNSASFKFQVINTVSTGTYGSVPAIVTWRPNDNFTDSQSLESTGYGYTAYADSSSTSSVTLEKVYTGTVQESESGPPKTIEIYAQVQADVGASRVYSGNSTATTVTDTTDVNGQPINNNHILISGNTASTTVLPHSSQRLNKVRNEFVPHLEEGRVVLNAYNEEAYWLNGYYSPDEIATNHYEAHNTIPFDGNTYVFDNAA